MTQHETERGAEIKLCPWCGGAAWTTGIEAFVVECRACRARGAKRGSAPAAIAAWNAAPRPSDLVRLREERDGLRAALVEIGCLPLTQEHISAADIGVRARSALASTSPAPLEALRAEGWMVAVHNDYRLNGEAHTFWLFTHPRGCWAKGEGRTDQEALAQCVSRASAALARLQEKAGDER
jgi:hypothetical protein